MEMLFPVSEVWFMVPHPGVREDMQPPLYRMYLFLFRFLAKEATEAVDGPDGAMLQMRSWPSCIG